MKVGRNDPCTCGSGKKYKFCCGAPGGAASRDWSVLGLLLAGIILLVGAATMIVGVVQSDPTNDAGLVWSPEHGHWHTSDGREVGRGTPTPQPPGEPPPGKVWSPEHGHWHDAP